MYVGNITAPSFYVPWMLYSSHVQHEFVPVCFIHDCSQNPSLKTPYPQALSYKFCVITPNFLRFKVLLCGCSRQIPNSEVGIHSSI